MLFMGGNNQQTGFNQRKSGDWQVREAIRKSCAAVKNASLCDNRLFNVANLALKQQSIFCLEPAGDTPSRKSIVDSITLGCIPVTFSGKAWDASALLTPLPDKI